MNVLLLNGSPHKEGNIYLALREMEQIFCQEGADTEIVHIGNKAIRGCTACCFCKEKGKCIFDDLVNQTAAKEQRTRTGTGRSCRRRRGLAGNAHPRPEYGVSHALYCTWQRKIRTS